MKVVYSNCYGANIGDHPWNTSKYALVLERLKEEGLIAPSDMMIAPIASDEDVLRVHTLDYWQKLYDLSFSAEEIERMEVPIDHAVVDLYWRAAGGTILASEQALTDGVCVHLGGGFHHAFPDHGSGFCLINDIAISLLTLLDKARIGNAAVIDCDLHQGDGTAFIFRNEPRVVTMSMHQRHAFPHFMQTSTIDVELENGIGDKEYQAALSSALQNVFDNNRHYDLVHYQAGADPYAGDTLGNLCLSIDGLLARDRQVISAARAANAPIVVTLGGGYPADVSDLVTIHCNTVKAAIENFGL
jgi:acetoin utilization deacetylase AcuC-like enzyme